MRVPHCLHECGFQVCSEQQLIGPVIHSDCCKDAPVSQRFLESCGSEPKDMHGEGLPLREYQDFVRMPPLRVSGLRRRPGLGIQSRGSESRWGCAARVVAQIVSSAVAGLTSHTRQHFALRPHVACDLAARLAGYGQATRCYTREQSKRVIEHDVFSS